MEREWAAAMAHFIAHKVANSNRTGFDRFEENWLLVYDNWTAPALEREKGLMLLRTELKVIDPWRIFSDIFVLDEKVLLEMSSNTSHFYHVNHCTA